MNNPTIEPNSATTPMIDTHCHLDDRQFKNDLQNVLQKSREANVSRWILIGYDPVRWDASISLAGSVTGMFHTVGVHPACAQQWNAEIAAELRKVAVESGAVGIGEAGLDFYRDNAPLEIQEAAFRGQLDIAAALNLPLVIHMRDAEAEMLRILGDTQSLPTLIFHSFDGSAELMNYIIESGSYVGIGGLATRQKSDMLREQLKRVPKERILLETDSPYLVPAKQKDRRNQPAQIATIAEMMAVHLGTTSAELAATSTRNAERVFGLNNE